MRTLQMPVDRGVNGWAVRDVGRVDNQFANVSDLAACFLNQHPQVPAGLIGLRPGVRVADKVAVQVIAGLALKENEVSTGADAA